MQFYLIEMGCILGLRQWRKIASKQHRSGPLEAHNSTSKTMDTGFMLKAMAMGRGGSRHPPPLGIFHLHPVSIFVVLHQKISIFMFIFILN